MNLDKMNVRILNLLQLDARKTVSDIARELNRAETTVRERIKKMESENVIKGYCAFVDKKALGYETEALIFCNVEPDKMEPVLKKLLKTKNVISVIHVTGARRVCLSVATKTNEEMWSFVHHTIIPAGCTDVDSHIVMRKYDKIPPDGIIEDDVD